MSFKKLKGLIHVNINFTIIFIIISGEKALQFHPGMRKYKNILNIQITVQLSQNVVTSLLSHRIKLSWVLLNNTAIKNYTVKQKATQQAYLAIK